MNIFEQASRNKLRISYKGYLAVEDLWDLELEELDTVYKECKKIVDANSNGLLSINTTDEAVTLTIDIVKYIFEMKIKERDERKSLADKALLKKKLTEALSEKQNDALKNMTEEELLSQLAEL